MPKLILSLLLSALCSYSFASEPNPQTSYRREVIQENGHSVYVVNARAPHLFMISRDLYGDEKSWQQIAKWNSLKTPYVLSPGQHLVLQKEPTSTPAQGDETLIAAWTKLDQWDIVGGITASQKMTGPMPASTEPAKTAPTAKADAETPVAKVASASESESAVKTESVTSTVKTESTTSTVKSETHTTAAHVEVAHEHESKWEFNTSAAVSQFRLDSNDTSSSIHNVFYSEIDYGVELEAAYRLGDTSHLVFSAAVEKMDIRELDAPQELTGKSQYLSRFSIGADRELNSRFSLMGSFIYDQVPYSKPTPDGADISAIYIPEFSLGANMAVYNRGSFSSWISAQGLLLLPKNQDGYDLNSGDGAVIAAKFENKLASNTLSYGIGYRYLHQDTDISKNHLDTYFANIGLIW